MAVRHRNPYNVGESFSPHPTINIGAGLNEGITCDYIDGFVNATTGNDYVWDPGGVYPFPTEALPVRIAAGGNAADTAGGDNARTVVVQGLDANWLPIEETLVTAGASASAYTSQSFLRINHVYADEVGVYSNENAGDINIETTTAVIGHVDALRGLSSSAIYTCPGNRTGYILRHQAFVESTKTVTLTMKVRRNDQVIAAPFHSDWTEVIIPSFTAQLEQTTLTCPIVVPPRADVWWQADTVSSTADVFIDFDIALVDSGQ